MSADNLLAAELLVGNIGALATAGAIGAIRV